MITFKDFFNKWMKEDKAILEEGLITSSSLRDLKKSVFSKFSEQILGAKDSGDESKPSSTIFIFNKDFNVDSIKPIVNFHGYFISKTKTDSKFEGEECLSMLIEPKFTPEIDIKTLKNVKFFHVTTRDKANKILKQGLAPKDTQTSFEHPNERIYVFYSKIPEVAIKSIKEMLKNDKGLKDEEEMVALEINFEKTIFRKFFIDLSFNNQGDNLTSIFTFKNIRPEELKEF